MIRPEVTVQRTIAALFSVVLMGLAGCVKSPFEPRAEAPKAPPVLVVGTDGSVAFKQPQPFMPEGHELGAGSRSIQVTKLVDGGKGGWLGAGRFLLVVSPGAFEGTGTITMSMKDSTAMVVDLEIAPADRNAFKAPVYLVANTTGLELASETLSLYWYDPAGRNWVGMPSESDLAAATRCAQEVNENHAAECPDDSTASSGVRTVLEHFSTYSAGKAGW